jgi:glycine cleavage system H protein
MAEFLETTVDKFIFRVATDRLYSAEGLWVQDKGSGRVTVGLADFPQQRIGDVAFVTVEPAGTKLKVGDDLADLETIKVTTSLASPVSGTIAAVNDALELNPELVNQSPYEKGWLAEIDRADWEAERASLLDAKAYFAVMKMQAEEEAKKP